MPQKKAPTKEKIDPTKTINSLKKELIVSSLESCGTYVIAAVASPIKEANEVKTISCKGLLPLGSLIYDTQSDSYLLSCFDMLHIGTVPISLLAYFESCPSWSCNIPLSEKIIKRYLNSKQKKKLKDFFSSFDSKFSKFYVQMLDPNI